MLKKYRIFGILILPFLIGAIFVYFVSVNFNPLRKEISSHIELYDIYGTYIGEILPKEKIRYFPTVEVPEISKKTLIAIEDTTFYQHFGISVRGIIRSLYRNTRAGEVQYGGSTITMGLARNLLGINRERTLGAKIYEMAYAVLLEIRYSKEEIITAYFDRAHFGRNTRGIEAASRSYFGKPLKDLGAYENIALVTLMKNPSKYDPIREPEAFRLRFGRIVETVEKTENIHTSSTGESNLFLDWKGRPEGLPYVVDGWKRTETISFDTPESLSQNYKITTTIDSGLTKKIETLADGVLFNLAKRNVQDYGVIVIDRKTHGIRVLIGGKNYHGEAGQVSSIFSPRQIGSTIKPFTYSLAIEKGIAEVSDSIQDLPVTFLTAEGNPYEPKNYSRTFQGKISVGEALAGSVNVPAILLTERVSTKDLLEFLKSVGMLSLNESADHYGLALGLGVGEVSLWELVRAYTLWSDDGKYCEITLNKSQAEQGVTCVQMLTEKTTKQIISTLSSQDIKSHEFPYGSTLDFGEGKVFVKTGTSRNFRDNYAVGFTHDFLIGVWTGNKDGENMRGVTGASGAGEIFASIVHELGSNQELEELKELNTPWKESKASLQEYLPKGSLPTIHSEAIYKNLKITSPTTNSQYSVKKGVPSEKQVIQIEYWSEKPLQNITYWLDGNQLTRNFIPLIPLSLGNHTVRVTGIDSNGKEMEDISWFQKTDTENK